MTDRHSERQGEGSGLDEITPSEALDIRRWAARAWLEMESVNAPPTPRNFALWFTHVSGANLDLSRQIEAVVVKGAAITSAALQTLHANFPNPQGDRVDVIDRTEAIQQAVETVVTEMTSNSAQLRQYGNTLSHWSEKLSQERSVDNLLQAVAVLTRETALASERNRALEQRLSASSARITRLKDNLADVKREATTDILTGLWNRKAFDTKLRRSLAEAKTDGGVLSVLMLDVDHFKRVNDAYGHHTGDLVLRLIGRLLSKSVKGRDLAARYGGEEFAVILEGADLTAAATVANQIRYALESKHLLKRRVTDEFGTITVSVGVAQFRAGDTPTTLLGRADVALYQAKNFGRNQVCVEERPKLAVVPNLLHGTEFGRR